MTIIHAFPSFREADGYIFPVTAQVATEESTYLGDYAKVGYCDQRGEWNTELWSLRDLMERLPSGEVEGDGSAVPRWITIYPEFDWYRFPFCRYLAYSVGSDVLSVTVSIHRPPQITDASWLRVCRLFGC